MNWHSCIPQVACFDIKGLAERQCSWLCEHHRYQPRSWLTLSDQQNKRTSPRESKKSLTCFLFNTIGGWSIKPPCIQKITTVLKHLNLSWACNHPTCSRGHWRTVKRFSSECLKCVVLLPLDMMADIISWYSLQNPSSEPKLHAYQTFGPPCSIN